MASNTDEAERRVREQRALIQQKLTDLEERVGSDLSHVRGRMQYHVDHASEMFPGGPKLMEQVEQHPTAALAGGLGLGVAAGMAGRRSSSGSRSRNGYREDDRDYRERDSGDGGISMLFGSITNSLIAPMRPYMEDAAKQVISGFADRRRGDADVEGRRQGRTDSEPAASVEPAERMGM